MTTIAVDGLNEEAFRRSIESRLRQGLAAEATAKLRALLQPYAGPDKILPERFLTVEAADLTLTGWDRLGEAIARHDRPGWPITALSIAFGWPGEEVPQPDASGYLSPLVETGYFSDESFPFSQSAREDLLDGYSYHGCTWADDSVATDTCLTLEGIDDLHGALALLEARLLASENPDEEGIRAGSLGACLLSALLFQAVALRIKRDGLPRPLCVLSGSNGVYPYFDAPVVGMPADALNRADEDEAERSQVPGPRYSSLLVTGIPRARKRAVLVLDESEADKALRTADLRNLAHGEDAAAANAPAAPEPGPDPADSGIVALPDGPLMARKQPHKAWDFRDMLGPRGPAGPPAPPPSFDFDDWDGFEPEPGDASTSLDDSFSPGPGHAAPAPVPPEEIAPPLPAARPEPAATHEGEEPAAPRLPRLPRTPAPEPGFSLLDDPVHERLQALIATPAEPPSEPVALVEPEPEPEPAAPAEPVWPLGIGWLEQAEADADAAAEDDEPAPRPGLLSRLFGWLSRRR